MKFWEKLKQTNDVWKKVFIFCLLVILAVPFLWLVGRNLNDKLNSTNKEQFYQILKFDKLNQAKDDIFSKMEEQMKDLESVFQKLQEVTSTMETTSMEQFLSLTTSTTTTLQK